MTKTGNYQLNQWDAADPVRRADFNADNVKIDAAVKSVRDAVSAETAARTEAVNAEAAARAVAVKSVSDAVSAETAARTAAVNGLNTALAQRGNCKIWTASYTGTGTAGSANPNKLTFPARPIFLWIANSRGVYFIHEFYGSTFLAMQAGNGSANCPAAWTETTVSWYDNNGNSTNQMNDKNEVYQVMALLAAD